MNDMNKFNSEILINQTYISKKKPVYFIADVASNHDGDLERAKDLIYLAKEAGANAVKFQHFTAQKIVSDVGFKALKTKQSHQAQWKKSVYETYRHYEAKKQWTCDLVEISKKIEIDFMTTPYDLEAIEDFKDIVPAFKVGSGDITWIDAIEKMAQTQKPILLATGASDLCDVERAVNAIQKINKNIVIMQCNTNYTASLENFNYINLNVLNLYALKWPEAVLGLSDHTLGHATVLGAVALGARVIEKHFTDSNSREGPDHLFSMNPRSWFEMVQATKELELALGDGAKRIEENEKETSVLQRRSIRLKNDMKKHQCVTLNSLEFLRPAPADSFPPFAVEEVLGKKLKRDMQQGEHITLKDFE